MQLPERPCQVYLKNLNILTYNVESLANDINRRQFKRKRHSSINRFRDRCITQQKIPLFKQMRTNTDYYLWVTGSLSTEKHQPLLLLAITIKEC
jgi:hypothetical protein